MRSPLSITPESQQKARDLVGDGANLSGPYLVMNALSALVACYGLLEDSSAVVIGAMIIAMLLGPIMGLAMALVDGDIALLRRSVVTEVAGVAIVLFVAGCIGLIHRDLPLTDQILSRTTPSILDLMIALGGGAAGAFATVSPGLSVGLVGVAIATALVPPLSVCGICAARGQYHLALGGLLLFFTNLVAIQFASSVVMWLHGFHRMTSGASSRWAYISRLGASLLLLFGLAGLLGVNFVRTVNRQSVEVLTRSTLKRALLPFSGAYLADTRFTPTENREIVYAVVRSPYSFGPKQVASLQALLPAIDGTPPELHVRTIITKEATAEGYVKHPQDSDPNSQSESEPDSVSR